MDTATKKTDNQQDSIQFLELHKQLFRVNRAELKARRKTSEIWQRMDCLLKEIEEPLVVTVRFDIVEGSKICLDSSSRIHEIPSRCGFSDRTKEQLREFFELKRLISFRRNGEKVWRLDVTGIIDDVAAHYISSHQVSDLHLRLDTCNPDNFVMLGIPYDSIVSIVIVE